MNAEPPTTSPAEQLTKANNMVETVTEPKTNPSAVIRQIVEVAQPADTAELALLGEQLHDLSSHRVLTFNRKKVEALIERLISDPENAVVFVTRSAGRIVGAFAGAIAPQWYSDDRVGFDYAVFIKPNSRHGIRSAALVQAFVIWCQRRGARQIRLGITTGIDVGGTSRLYHSLGFVDAGVAFSKEIF